MVTEAQYSRGEREQVAARRQTLQNMPPEQAQQFINEGQTGGIGAFMAATRRLESGSYDGVYQVYGRPVKGDRARGAYQIMSKNWKSWARRAGVSGADWRDPAAQDRVAAHVMQEYFQRYGNWDLVAVAWYAGQGSADKVAKRGYTGPDSIRNPHIRGYVQKIRNYIDTPEAWQYGVPATAGLGNLGRQRSWVFPVAGDSDWSRGSYMPHQKTHRGRTHAAVDIYAKAGTPVISPVSGRVQSVGSGGIGGNTVQLRGNDGNLYYFAHMKSSVPKRGDVIQAGQHLGFVGNTGSARSTKPHLHFSMRNPKGDQVSPISFLEGSREFESFAGMETSQMGLSGKSGFSQSWHQMIQRASDMIAGGDRQDYRTFGQQVEEDGTAVIQQSPDAGIEPMERKSAKQLAKPLDGEEDTL